MQDEFTTKKYDEDLHKESPAVTFHQKLEQFGFFLKEWARHKHSSCDELHWLGILKILIIAQLNKK